MKSRTKSCLSILMAMCLAFAGFPTSAIAEALESGEGIVDLSGNAAEPSAIEESQGSGEDEGQAVDGVSLSTAEDPSTTNEVTCTTWSGIQTAIDDATGATTIILGDDCTATTNGTNPDTVLTISADKSITLDLNGHTLDRGLSTATEATQDGSALRVVTGATLIITNSNTSKVGLITGGYAKCGGGINNEGTLTLTAGVIRNNRATDGGGIHLATSGATLSLEGGTVYANEALGKGGGVYVGKDAGAINAEGAPAVRDNTATTGGDVYLAADQVINLTGALDAAAELDVWLESRVGVITSGYGTHHDNADPGSYFDCDSGFGLSLTTGGEVQITSVWQSLQGLIDNAADGDTISLSRDYTAASAEGPLTIAADKRITIDLNGHKVDRDREASSESGHVFSVLGELTVTDTSDAGKGVITGGFALQGGGVYIAPGGCLNLCGGTIQNNQATKLGGGVYNEGTLHLSGGTIKKNEAGESGGGVYASASSDTGEIYAKGSPYVFGNTSDAGANVHLQASDEGTLPTIKVEGKLEDAVVGVTLSTKTGTFTTGYPSYNDGVDPSRFFKDDEGLVVYADESSKEATIGVAGESDEDYENPFIERGSQISYATPDGANWMSGISGERYLNEINLPCTHDSGCNKVWSYSGTFDTFAQTQVRFIDEQLEDGIRKLDIRLNNYHETEDHLLSVTFSDDGENLWICHGKSWIGGTYWCKNRNDDDLSFSEVLSMVKEFLKNHPTETVILSFEAEINTSFTGHNEEEDREKVWERLTYHMYELSRENNPSTGESYLYSEPDSSSPLSLYTKCPQLKDCRGKVVILSGGEYKDKIGGLDWGKVGISVKSEGENDCRANTKINNVNKFYDKNDWLTIPETADCEHLKTFYYVGTTTSGPKASAYATHSSPIDYAKEVHFGFDASFFWEDDVDGLFDPEKPSVFDTLGRYYGWIRLDRATAEVNRFIWKTNFVASINHVNVVVEPGFVAEQDLTQRFKLLKNTQITIPDCIYTAEQSARANGRFGGWMVKGENVSGTYQPGDTFTVSEDVTFTPLWIDDSSTEVKVVWKDGSNEDHLRPSKLQLDVSTGTGQDDDKTVTITEDAGWTGVVSDSATGITPSWERVIPTAEHPQGQDAQGEYRYEVSSGNASGSYVVTMYHTPSAMTDVKGEVMWNDGEDVDKKRPKSVTIYLYDLQTKVGTVTVTADDSWKFSVNNLPKYRDGQVIVYTVKQDSVAEYTTFSAGLLSFNFHPIKSVVTSVPCTIEWVDGNNAGNTRPKSVTVRLLANGEVVRTKTAEADEDDNWICDFAVLPKYDDKGKEIAYSVEQVKADGYKSSTRAEGSCVVITNTHEHTSGREERLDEVAPTCTKNGSYVRVIYCKECGEEASRETVTVPALGHDWGDPTYAWADDLATATATHVCKRDGAHQESADAIVSFETTKYPTATEAGTRVYTTKFDVAWAKTQTKSATIDPLGDDSTSYFATTGTATWRRGSTSTLGFSFTRATDAASTFSHFTGVMVDGRPWGQGYLATRAKGVTIELLPTHLNQLALGTHAICPTFDDGTCEQVTFVVLPASPTGKAEKYDTILKYAKKKVTKKVGNKGFVNKLTNPYGVKVRYKSSNTKVAKVNKKTGKVTIKGAGTAKITASYTGNSRYKAAKATYTIKVGLAKTKGLVTVCHPPQSTIDFTWSKVKGATFYQLQWRVRGGKWKTLKARKTQATIEGVKAGKYYEVRVRAASGKVRGAWSKASRRWYVRASGVRVKAAAKGKVRVGWSATKGANRGYVVYVRYSEEGAPVAKKTVKAGKTSTVISGLKSGRKAWVSVRPMRSVKGTTYVGVLTQTVPQRVK